MPVPASGDYLYLVQLRGAAPGLAGAAELLSALDFTPAIWQHEEEPAGLLSLYFDTPGEAERAHDRLAGMLPEWAPLLQSPLDLLPVATMAREDWAESWKRFFHARRLSSRVAVCPSWERSPQDVAVVVEMDPGMSFGTGQHATTTACVQLIDDLAAAGDTGSLLDLGCGSGILSIAAAKLGFAPVLAMDIDPIAVTATIENVARNQVASTVTARQHDLAVWEPAERWHVTVANILAPVLIEHARRVAAGVATGGWLILSGILTTQFEDVQRAYGAHGLRLERSLALGEWTTGLFRSV